ncbi:MAG: hypothetical protein NT151_01625 [Acidobacteria bacterium]|nr:hypothetical protein [Acidobacteriota bacterium]
MESGARASFRVAILLGVVGLAVLGASGCGSGLVRQYEYEEEIYLSVDGSASVYVNTSLAALVNLRGVDLKTDPSAPLDRDVVRKIYNSDVAHVVRVSAWRRFGRRFVQVRLQVDDITKLGQAPLLAWSTYQIDRLDDLLVYRQRMGASAAKPVGPVGWNGSELVAVRLHLPSRIRYHNAGADNLKRGNILVWEQTLVDRQAGKPIEIEARIERTSILYSTLMLFAVSGGLALLVMVLIICWVVRKGRGRVKS